MTISNYALEKLCEFEGFRSSAYLCPAGVWTIGYGHTPAKPNSSISESAARKLLVYDLEHRFYPCALSCLLDSGDYTQSKFDAVVMLIYNIGCTAFLKSKLRRAIIQRDDDQISKQWLRWCHVNGKFSTGLRRRRLWELDHFYDSDFAN